MIKTCFGTKLMIKTWFNHFLSLVQFVAIHALLGGPIRPYICGRGTQTDFKGWALYFENEVLLSWSHVVFHLTWVCWDLFWVDSRRAIEGPARFHIGKLPNLQSAIWDTEKKRLRRSLLLITTLSLLIHPDISSGVSNFSKMEEHWVELNSLYRTHFHWQTGMGFISTSLCYHK